MSSKGSAPAWLSCRFSKSSMFSQNHTTLPPSVLLAGFPTVLGLRNKCPLRGTQCPNFMSQSQRLMSTFTSAPDTLVLFALYLLYHPCIYSELEPLHQKADHSLFVSIFYCIVAPRTNKKPTFKQISKFCSLTSPTHCLWTGAASSMFCRKQRAGPGKIRKAGGREMTCWQFSV